MTFASLAWLWFALAVVCILAGLALTGRRVAALPPAKRVVRAKTRVYRKGYKRDSVFCSRCAQALEADARFCGACGCKLGRI